MNVFVGIVGEKRMDRPFMLVRACIKCGDVYGYLPVIGANTSLIAARADMEKFDRGRKTFVCVACVSKRT